MQEYFYTKLFSALTNQNEYNNSANEIRERKDRNWKNRTERKNRLQRFDGSEKIGAQSKWNWNAIGVELDRFSIALGSQSERSGIAKIVKFVI